MNVAVQGFDEAQASMISQYRDTRLADGNRTKIIFDIAGAPGLLRVREGFHVGDHFEPDETYYLVEATDRRYDDPAVAVQAWAAAEADYKILDGLAHALRRQRFGRTASPWEHMSPQDKSGWIMTAKIFRDMLHRVGMDIKPLETAL